MTIWDAVLARVTDQLIVMVGRIDNELYIDLDRITFTQRSEVDDNYPPNVNYVHRFFVDGDLACTVILNFNQNHIAINWQDHYEPINTNGGRL